MRKKIALIIPIILILPFLLKAQTVNPYGRVNLSIGTEYNELDYAGSTLLYSTGGGIGLEVGANISIQDKLFLRAGLAYQLHLALQYESANGVSNRSRFNFNRKTILLGAYKSFILNDRSSNKLIFGIGTTFNIPGKLKLEENNNDLGTFEYENNLGYFFEAGYEISLSKISLTPSLRYRSLSFEIESINGVAVLTDELSDTNASGFELALIITRR